MSHFSFSIFLQFCVGQKHKTCLFPGMSVNESTLTEMF